MLTIQPRTWQRVIEFYEGMMKHGWSYAPMLNLVRQITASQYVVNPPVMVLYPATSLDVLLIAPVEPMVWKTDMLEIRYVSPSQQFHFDFWESEYVKKHWSRTSDIANSFTTFERFMYLKRWA